MAGLKHASAVWTGTGTGDELNGTEVADTINGLGGNDAITGAAGNDTLNGGAGSDTLAGGPGNDVITDAAGGGSSRAVAARAKPAKFVNVVDAGAGNDRINVFNRRRDRVECGRGKDRVTADRNDRLSGCEKVKRRRK